MRVSAVYLVLVALAAHGQELTPPQHRTASSASAAATTSVRRHTGIRESLWNITKNIFRRRSTSTVRRSSQQVLQKGQKLYCKAPKSLHAIDSRTNTTTTSSAPQSSLKSSAAASWSTGSVGATVASNTFNDSPPTTRDSPKTTSSSTSPTQQQTTTSPSQPTTTSSPSPTPTPTPTTSSTQPPPPPPTPSSLYQISQDYSGNDFFNDWNWFTGPDVPTSGKVYYVDAGTAQNARLASVNDKGNFIMAVDTTGTVTDLRQSVRIQSKQSYRGGIVVLDAVHMPTGCATWPAFWSNGPGIWPAGGEIDILENVNDITVNQATLHTGFGCTIPSTDPAVLGVAGSVMNLSCKSGEGGEPGCGIRAWDTKSFGSGFNSAGGGVYAMKWDDSGIAVWSWPSGSVPGDVSSGVLKPENWGQPGANFPSSTCDPWKNFGDQTLIFDTTLCGNWAGASWGQSGVPGQETSCAERTGFSSCEDFVRSNGAAFTQAYWEVRSVKVYNRRT